MTSDSLYDLAAHPAADLFPMMSEEETAALAADIAEHGQQHPILLLDGCVLDGRNRLKACEIAGVEPEFKDVEADDPVDLVISLNVMRRNMTKRQLAVVAAEAYDLISPGQGARTSAKNGRSRDELATMFGVSSGYIGEARYLLEHAPEVAADVKAGKADLVGAAMGVRDALSALGAEKEQLTREELAAEQELTELRRRMGEIQRQRIETRPPPPRDSLDFDSEAFRQSLQRETGGTAEADATPRKTRSPEMKTWGETLDETNRTLERVRALPAWPEDPEPLFEIAAREIAKLLWDAAARIVEALPDQPQTLRRVK